MDELSPTAPGLAPTTSTDPASGLAPQDLTRFATYRIYLLSRLLSVDANRFYSARVGLTLAQWRVLSTLGTFGEMSIGGIAEHISMDRGQTSRTIDALTNRGFIRMRPNVKDRRSTLLSLSSEGEALYHAALPLAAERQSHLLDGFSQHEIEVFDRVLDELIARVSDAR
ncbi:MAG: winged helix-turn-helix transcriptional regulator [Pararhodobacter sp.]|nr:winged helix-turn-helix transcriptional regulator [Pararhodobacter sp.]